MDMTPIEYSDSPRSAPPVADRLQDAPGRGALVLRWEAIHAAAGAVAAFAGIAAQPPGQDVQAFPQALLDFGGWRRNVALQGVEDLAAILDPGLAALLAVHDNGMDAAPAAIALWQEFLAARNALLALALPLSEGLAA